MTSKKSNVINLADRYFRAQCDRLGPITPYEKMLANSILNHAKDLNERSETGVTVCEGLEKVAEPAKRPRHAFKARPVPAAPKPRTEEDQARAFLEWAKTQEARLCFSAVPIDEAKLAADNARGEAADKAFEWPTPRTAADFNEVFKPTCRICGEEGHDWRRCGSD